MGEDKRSIQVHWRLGGARRSEVGTRVSRASLQVYIPILPRYPTHDHDLAWHGMAWHGNDIPCMMMKSIQGN